MEITSYTDFRQNLKSFLDKVVHGKLPLFVTRKNGENVVVLSKDEYDGIQETMHLLSSPTNALRLKESLQEYKAKGGEERELLDS